MDDSVSPSRVDATTIAWGRSLSVFSSRCQRERQVDDFAADQVEPRAGAVGAGEAFNPCLADRAAIHAAHPLDALKCAAEANAGGGRPAQRQSRQKTLVTCLPRFEGQTGVADPSGWTRNLAESTPNWPWFNMPVQTASVPFA